MKKPTAKRRRAGQGVVIGNLLILSASVMMATIVLYWALSFQGGAQTAYSTAIFQSNAQVSEQLSIDDVYFNSTGGKSITVYVRNFGDIPFRVVQIYVDSEEYNTTETTVVARSSTGVWVDYSSWSSGETHIISVATQRGNQYERSFKVP